MEAENTKLPLEQFLYRSFGDAVCAVVTAGLGRSPGAGVLPFTIKELFGQGETVKWELGSAGHELSRAGRTRSYSERSSRF